MNATAPTVTPLQTQYQKLRRQLAQIGYISQGSVQERTVARSGRTGRQWTRKVAQKTVTVALSPEQYAAMKEAVANQRKASKIIREMERVSRSIIFASTPDTHRRKRLSKKVLGLN